MQDPVANALANVCVVLVGTTHPGNIGAVARAMKTMGLTQLRLVAPKYFPHEEANARAAGAVDLLDSTQVYATFAESIADCGYVVGASARVRTIPWPTMNVREAACQLVANAVSTTVAVVLGPERVGLSNQEIDRCHALLQIPANPAYASLNIAAAAQVIAYELRIVTLNESDATSFISPPHVPANAQDMEFFYDHLEKVFIALEFLDPENPRQLMRRVRRLFNRAQPDALELNILRGILAAIDAKNAKSSS